MTPEERASVAANIWWESLSEGEQDVMDFPEAFEAGWLNAWAALRTWAGFMELLDRYYPPAVFDSSSGDPGARIVVLVRALDEERRRAERVEAAVRRFDHAASTLLGESEFALRLGWKGEPEVSAHWLRQWLGALRAALGKAGRL